jgi:hypothetical protein
LHGSKKARGGQLAPEAVFSQKRRDVAINAPRAM